MATPQQIEANQANAQLSTGPVTPQGKAASARNSYQHGFRATTLVITEADRPEFDALCAELERHFMPVDFTERRLVREMIDAEFSLRQCRAAMQSALARQMEKIIAAEPELDSIDLQSRAIEALAETRCSWSTWLRYESKFERQYERANQEWNRYHKQLTTAKDTATDVRIVRHALGLPHDAMLRLKLASSVQSPPPAAESTDPPAPQHQKAA